MRRALAAPILLLFLFALACDRRSAPAHGAPAAPDASASTGAAPTTSPSTSASTAASSRPAVPMPPPSETAPLAKASNAFAFALYDQVRSRQGNLAMSPASVSCAVAMSYGGARGETAAEIRKALRFTGDPAAVMSSWGKLARALSSAGRPVTSTIASRLFGEASFHFEEAYLDRTRVAFGSELERVDLAHAPERARAHINGWVDGQTHGRIKDLIPARALTPQTRLVLVNAFYFLARWAHPFDGGATRDEPFTLATSAKKKTPMMHERTTVSYAKVPGAALVALPYQDDVASLLIVLPDQVGGIASLEGSLATNLEGWRARMTSQLVDVTLPRFEMNPDTLALAPVLRALGMRTAFDRAKADFTGIANPPDPKERLAIDAIFHKAFVKVDEVGTEAAAATGLLMAPAGIGVAPKPVKFVADHPFFFAIVDHATGLILLDGRLAEP